MGKIAREVGAYLFVDMAHIAGLVAAGVHPNPVPHADFVTSTTHKTLRGPRGGIILCKEEFAKKIDSQVFPGIQGGPLMHVIAAKAVCFGEALKPEFKDYSAAGRQERAGPRRAPRPITASASVSGGTDNHLMLVDLRRQGPQRHRRLARPRRGRHHRQQERHPLRHRQPDEASGIRIGTPAVTTRGMKEKDVEQVADFISEALSDHTNLTKLHALRDRVFAFNRDFPLPW